ncbi:MAG: hypothetical protein ACRDTF_15300 [Pseudonocardiaceae bacterium]
MTALAARLQPPAPENCWELIDAVAKLPYPPILVFDGLSSGRSCANRAYPARHQMYSGIWVPSGA